MAEGTTIEASVVSQCRTIFFLSADLQPLLIHSHLPLQLVSFSIAVLMACSAFNVAFQHSMTFNAWEHCVSMGVTEIDKRQTSQYSNVF